MSLRVQPRRALGRNLKSMVTEVKEADLIRLRDTFAKKYSKDAEWPLAKAVVDKLLGRPADLVDQIQDIRTKNNVLWMDILRVALRRAPAETRRLLTEITANDRRVSRLTAKLAAGGRKR